VASGRKVFSAWAVPFLIWSSSGAGARYWAAYYKHVTTANIETAHQLGIQVFVWAPDDPSDMMRLIEMGVDGIITNRPDRLQSVLDAFSPN
jgi:glycerophosphoryl diester phosphodiesterase